MKPAAAAAAPPAPALHEEQAAAAAVAHNPAVLQRICSHLGDLDGGLAWLARMRAASPAFATAAAEAQAALTARWHGLLACMPAAWQPMRDDVPRRRRPQLDEMVMRLALGAAAAATLPPTLSNKERRWLHERAASVGLHSTSDGHGGGRRLTLSKPVGWAMSWEPRAQPSPSPLPLFSRTYPAAASTEGETCEECGEWTDWPVYSMWYELGPMCEECADAHPVMSGTKWCGKDELRGHGRSRRW